MSSSKRFYEITGYCDDPEPTTADKIKRIYELSDDQYREIKKSSEQKSEAKNESE